LLSLSINSQHQLKISFIVIFWPAQKHYICADGSLLRQFWQARGILMSSENEDQTEKEIFNKLQLLFSSMEEIILGPLTMAEKIKDVLYFAKMMIQLEDADSRKSQRSRKSGTRVKPFLFWGENKFHRVEEIRTSLPPGKRLVEPFVGSGSVFLNTNYDSYLLADVDRDVINIFQVLAEYQEEFIEKAKQFFLQNPVHKEILEFYAHMLENTPFMKAIKDERIERACKFLYVNRNSVKYLPKEQKEINGSSKQKGKVYFPDDELKACLEKINSCNVEFLAQDYQETLALAKEGDVIFCDPPSIVVTSKNYRFNIGQQSFTHGDHVRQGIRGSELQEKGVSFITFPHEQFTPVH
jgi:DNA adenine methylase